MAVVVNERDVLLRSSFVRVLDATEVGNAAVPPLKGLTLRAPGTIFRIDSEGSPSPSAITITASLRGLPETTSINWVVSVGSGTLTGSGPSRTLAYADMASETLTVTASVDVGGMVYSDSISFLKLSSGTGAAPGVRAALSVVRTITGSSWSNLEAAAAIAEAGGGAPIATDTCTLVNSITGYGEMRRFGGVTWVPIAQSMPGNSLLKQSLTVEQLIVAGLGVALNSDPNTSDIGAWSGAGISITSDSTAPNGSTCLRCTGLGTEVLSERFAIDPTENYRVRTWVRQQEGHSTAYLLVAFYDANGLLINGSTSPSGWSHQGKFHYYGLVAEEPSGEWEEKIVGFGANETFKAPAGARSARVGLISNFTGSGAQLICGLICHTKTAGSMIVEGSVTAREIDTRGLTIKGRNGNVVLEAGDDVSPAALQSPVNLQVPSAVYVGTASDGLYIGSTGIVGVRAGARTFSVDQLGNAEFAGALRAAVGTFAGALQSATGEFAGSLAAGVLNPTVFDSIRFEFTTAGNHSAVVPAKKAGWSAMRARAILNGGGGGGGGGFRSGQPNADPTAGGGGGGAGSRVVIDLGNVTPGQTLAIHIGARGEGGYAQGSWAGSAGATPPAGNGTPGGPTTLTYNGNTYEASGGGGGTGGGPLYAYGGGGNFDLGQPAQNVPGGSLGGEAGYSGTGSNSNPVAPGGRGGDSFYGTGGVPGQSANGYGAGGGGGYGAPAPGAAGGVGYMSIEFYDPNIVVVNNRYLELIQWLDGIGFGAVPTAAR